MHHLIHSMMNDERLLLWYCYYSYCYRRQQSWISLTSKNWRTS